MHIKKINFTLVEITIVVIILSILAVVGIPFYRRAVIRTYQKEAQALLVLIQQAEEMYRLEFDNYTNCCNTSYCNDRLRLNLPSSGVWNYRVINANKTFFCAEAVSSNMGAFHITPNLTNASNCDCANSNCP